MCSGPLDNNCLVCAPPYLFRNSYCIAECPVGDFADPADLHCKPCHSSCQTCFGPLDVECDQCKPGGVYAIKKCLYFDCPDGQFRNLQNNLCEDCPLNCRTCTSAALGSCLSCLTSKWLYDGKCLNKCPDLFYGDPRPQECFSCHTSCANCEGPSNRQCKQCFSRNYWGDTVENSGGCKQQTRGESNWGVWGGGK